MNKRLLFFFIGAFIPVVILVALYPERAFKGTIPEQETAAATGATIVAFVSDNCPHCAAFKDFAKKQQWPVAYREISEKKNQDLFARLQKRAPALRQGVPTVIVNGHVVQGYESDATTGGKLKKLLENYRDNPSKGITFEAFLQSDRTATVETTEETCVDCAVDFSDYIFNVPVIGEVNLALLSLPALSILLGFLDGFNPCAMWVLITLLTLLIATRDQKKVWIIGGTFLFVSGAMYYLFIAAWLNAFLILGFNAWVQKIIALVAIGGGGFYLYEALGKDPNACQVTDGQQKKRIMERMRAILQQTMWPAMLLGVVILAVSVNAIEPVCTAGLPA
ncbi:MAG: glutaredoxin family protein, partial [Candidatus Peribacteraceae bacterium]|nr:glutaredoxin family protein [Candidatus Peribacteraceae bacterium]